MTGPAPTRHEVLRLAEQYVCPDRVRMLLALADAPGLVLKRMAGFADVPAADAYRELVTDYVAAVRGGGVPVLDTEVLVVRRPSRGPVTYLVQPEVAQDRLRHNIMRTADDATHEKLLHQVLDGGRSER